MTLDFVALSDLFILGRSLREPLVVDLHKDDHLFLTK